MCDAKIELLVTDALTFQQNNGRIRVFSPKIVNGEGLPLTALVICPSLLEARVYVLYTSLPTAALINLHK